MRRLAQPEVLKSAGIAALLTAILCYPRLNLWTARLYPLWYLEAVLFFGGIVLWAFVFAWHTHYSGRPVFTLRIEPRLFALITLAGAVAAVCVRLFLDPTLRLRTPEDYPANFEEWFARTLFHLAFLQLFLTFAPFAWLIRLTHRQTIAIALTILFGVAVLTLKSRVSPTPVPAGLFAMLLASRIVLGFASLWIYLRGGVLLAWWWGLIFEARHLAGLG